MFTSSNFSNVQYARHSCNYRNDQFSYWRVVVVVNYFLMNAIMKEDEEDIVVLLKCLILTIVCVWTRMPYAVNEWI